jgi:23S rRNA (cytosine1962-C5)-methyltransferase
VTTALQSSLPPCVLHEDEHLLVVNKPAGWNTHAPSPFAGEGIYDWLKHREPRWANLAIIHRLDKETSGVMVFGKTPLANRSLTEQFAGRAVRKTYVLLTDLPPKQIKFLVKSRIIRVGDRYVSGKQGEEAETKFEVLIPKSKIHHPGGGSSISCCELSAEPLTGRTHQIRVHAAANGFPILGDSLYGGRSFQRVCLHAHSLEFKHPVSNRPISFEVKPKFERHWSEAIQNAIFDHAETNAFRLTHGATHLTPGFYSDALGDYVLAQRARPLDPAARTPDGYLGTYFKLLTRHIRGNKTTDSCPKHFHGQVAPESFIIRENGVQFELSFNEGYSVGLFLDQRDNRRRLLTGHVAANFPLRDPEIRNPKSEILNCFAYTCGFSVCAALGGAKTTSLDLSKKYLAWGRRNFTLNGLDSAAHDFIYGDAFDWLKRLTKKRRAFDVVILDPPTFSQSKESGVFRVEKDFGQLAQLALPVLKPGGVLFASSNAAHWPPAEFLTSVRESVAGAGRRIAQEHYVPQPPDFPISRTEPAYLKTVWLRVN